MNMASFYRKWVEETPDKTAIIFQGNKISYKELDRQVNKVAKGLVSLGLKKGDVVSLFLPSCPELIMSYLGTVRAGMVVNVLNAMLKEIEVEYIMNDCQTKAVIMDKSRVPIVEKVGGKIASLKHRIVLRGDDKNAETAFENMVAKASDQFTPVEMKEEELCHLMYTSGTTGWPKGVMATHRNITHNVTEFGKVHFKESDTIMVATPIFHCWGLINGTFGMLGRGGTVNTVERFFVDKGLDEIEEVRPTIFIGVPPMYNLLVKAPDIEKRKIDSIRFCLSAATKMPVELIKMVEDKLRWKYGEAWGLTEVSCVGTTAPHTETRLGSCGRGMGGAEIKVVDPDGKEAPVGERGELCIRGTCVTLGYLNKPDATKEVFDEEGWFHSGDIAVMDEDGFVYIVDRKKDMINVGGEKVFPSEVEDIMLTNPQIKDLVIIGLPDELKGEAPKAFIELKKGESATEDDIRAFCKTRMAPYKIPSWIEFVDEIPRSASGKALRRVLKDQEMEKLQQK